MKQAKDKKKNAQLIKAFKFFNAKIGQAVNKAKETKKEDQKIKK